MTPTRTLPFLLALPLFGCTGKPSDSGDTNEPVDDTAADDTGDAPADFTFALTGDYAGSTLTLTWINFATIGTDTLDLGEVAYTGAVTGATKGVSLPEPPAGDLQEVDPTNAPGMMLAGYVPGLHLDADGDGLQSGDEVYVGAGLTWPVFLSGTIPADYADMGLVDGWNALELVPDSQEPVMHDITAIPLAASLAERTSITLGGSYVGDDGASLAILPSVMFEGGSVETYVYDGALDDPWSVTLDGAPEADHFAALQGVGLGALEVPIAYTDSDGSGGHTSPDPLAFPACSDGVVAGLVYLPGVTDLMTGWSLTLQGVGSGWVGLTLEDSGGMLLSDAQLQDLALDGSCTF